MSTEKMQDAGRNNERPARRFERKKARQSKRLTNGRASTFSGAGTAIFRSRRTEPSTIPSRLPISRLEQPVGCQAAERLFVPKNDGRPSLPCTSRNNARILWS
jgi:hypothetical protein